jgi:hypothetical protein
MFLMPYKQRILECKPRLVFQVKEIPTLNGGQKLERASDAILTISVLSIIRGENFFKNDRAECS